MEWKAQRVRRVVDAYEAALPPGAWPNWVLGNHDRKRTATRVGAAQAGAANMLLLTLRGTPTTYYGEEIGMENVPVPIEQALDPLALNLPTLAHIYGRDPVRTPMQWDGSPNAGFSPAGVKPWLPLAADYTQRNVAAQDADPRSMLNLYRALVRLRRSEPALHAGEYRAIDSGAEDVFAYLRTSGEDSFLIALNFGAGAHRLDLSAAGSRARVEISTRMDRAGEVDLRELDLRPNEGVVARIINNLP
jgi:alpha-glucosidase